MFLLDLSIFNNFIRVSDTEFFGLFGSGSDVFNRSSSGSYVFYLIKSVVTVLR